MTDKADQIRLTGAVAHMGEIFCETQEEKNAWKKRMLKAGLEKLGLNFPSDWDSLPEDEKERRLNQVLAVTKEV